MIEKAIRDYLLADAALATNLTGGVYAVSALGYQALAPDNNACSTAFPDTNGMKLLTICATVFVRTELPDYGLMYDASNRNVGWRVTVLVRLYDERDAAPDRAVNGIDLMSKAIFQRLAGKSIELETGRYGTLMHSQTRPKRDPSLNDALVREQRYLLTTTALEE